MDFSIPPELAELRGRLANFIDEELRPLEREYQLDEEGEIPQDLARQLRRRAYELGFYAVGVPKELGGGGVGQLGVALLREEIARSGSRLANVAISSGLGVLAQCTGSQRDEYLFPVVRGDKIYCFAFTEPQGGSSFATLQTSARPEGSSFMLNGRKSFITGARTADFVIVIANAEATAHSKGGITTFIVDMPNPGLRIDSILYSMEGGEGHCELAFEDCAVPATNVLGQVGQGIPTGLGFITANRLMVSARALGVAQRALSMSVERAKRPHPSGVSLGQREGIQTMLGEMATQLYAARLMVHQACWSADQGNDVTVEAAMVKLFASEMAGRLVDTALQIHGGAAVIKGHPLERLYRMVRGWRLGEGASEILRMYVGRATMTG